MAVDTFATKIPVIRGDTNSYYKDNLLSHEAVVMYPIRYAARRKDSTTYQLTNAMFENMDIAWVEFMKTARAMWMFHPPITDPHVYTEVVLPNGFEFIEDSNGRKLPPAIIARAGSETVSISPTQNNDTFLDIIKPEAITRVTLEEMPDTPALLVSFTTVGINVHVEELSPSVRVIDSGPLIVKVDAERYSVRRGAVIDLARIEIFGIFDKHLMLPNKQLELDKVVIYIEDNVPVETIDGFSLITEVRAYNLPADAKVSIYRHFETDVELDAHRPFVDPIRDTFSHTGRRKTIYWSVFDKDAHVSDIDSMGYFPETTTGTGLGICWKNPEYTYDNNADMDIALGWQLLDKNGGDVVCDSYAVLTDRNLAVILGNNRNTLYFYDMSPPRMSMFNTKDTGAVLVDLEVDYAGTVESVPMCMNSWVARLSPINLSIAEPIKYRLRIDKPSGESVYIINVNGEHRETPSYGFSGWQAWDNNEFEYTVSGPGVHTITFEVAMNDGTLSRIVRVLQSLSVRAFLEIDLNQYGSVGSLSCDSFQNMYITIDGTRYKVRFHRDIVNIDYDNKVLYVTEVYDSVMVGGIDFGN